MKTARRAPLDEGQALVEFALVVPVIILLLVGIFEFGKAWNAYQAITDAAREGARTAVIADSDVSADSVRRVVRNALTRVGLDATRAQVELVGVDAASGEPARVTIRYPYQFGFLKPLQGITGSGSFTLGSSFVMRNE